MSKSFTRMLLEEPVQLLGAPSPMTPESVSQFFGMSRTNRGRVYPALKVLQAQGLVKVVENADGRATAFAPTEAGLARFKKMNSK